MGANGTRGASDHARTGKTASLCGALGCLALAATAPAPDRSVLDWDQGSAEIDSLTLTGATFLGGSGIDDAYEVSVALAGASIYVSGFTSSPDFPVTAGAYGPAFRGGTTDRFIARLDDSLSRLSASSYVGGAGVAAGFVGGNGDDLGHAIAVDAQGNVFVAGYTDAADYPVTAGAFDPSYNGGRDVVVSKFDPGLTTLLASTFLGGSGDEGYRWPRIDMSVTGSGDVVIAGITHSVDFPVTADAFDRSFNGGSESGDAFVAILDNSLRTLRSATYLGGSLNEWRVSVEPFRGSGIFVCGETESSDFPTTVGSYDRALSTIKDVFLVRLDNDLSSLGAGTFFGGSKLDEALDLAVTPEGDVFITGYTESQDLPVTPDAYRRSWGGGNTDGYLARFDGDLTRLIASTLFGGSGTDFPRGLAVDEVGNLHVTGNTTSADFADGTGTTGRGFRGGTSRGDVFLVTFDARLTRMGYAALVGGSGEDTGTAIAIDATGRVVVAGSTTSSDFPADEASFAPHYNGGVNDGFVMEFTRTRPATPPPRPPRIP